MHPESHLYVNLRRQTRKNDFWGSPGPSTRGGHQKRPKGSWAQIDPKSSKIREKIAKYRKRIATNETFGRALFEVKDSKKG